ncbi:uncharacterized protein LOC123523224 [Mercenaria mercenaria]|uniref:uncharacterized protein LOC123523224 n=1 Tax=Mercenaria mercenaria TaxID=6596 RepID=UPI00234E3C06|nr:uncharacterized protein LOC123523224 [Mercenaria mercenaria]
MSRNVMHLQCVLQFWHLEGGHISQRDKVLRRALLKANDIFTVGRRLFKSKYPLVHVPVDSGIAAAASREVPKHGEDPSQESSHSSTEESHKGKPSRQHQGTIGPYRQ